MDNVDYKELYLIMVRAFEKAIRCLETEENLFKSALILIEAQRLCEELYLQAGDQEEGLPNG